LEVGKREPFDFVFGVGSTLSYRGHEEAHIESDFLFGCRNMRGERAIGKFK
jgi:hypothetical protein